MKAKVSWLSWALLVIVLNVAVLLVLAGGSTRLASGSASFRQGAGRPTTTTPKPTRIRRKKRHTLRSHPTAAAGNANKVNNAAERHADAGGNANNNNTRPSSTPAAGNTNDSSNSGVVLNPEGAREVRAPADNNSNASVIPSVSNTADPAAESKTQSAPAGTSPPLKTPEKTNPDADILLPDDFRKLESQSYLISATGPASNEPTLNPLGLRPKPGKLFNTTGTFPEIANRRKVFVNIRGEYGDKITARLRAYGRLEVVKTAGEAELAVSYYDWAAEERVINSTSPLGVWEAGTKSITGGTLIITIRDPSAHMPRIVWRNDDTDGGWFKRGDAVDKLTKRFISELKKLRGEK